MRSRDAQCKSVKGVSVIFDETARKPTQRLIRLEVLAKALKGEELAQRLKSCLAVDYKFGARVVIGGCEIALP